MTGSVDYFAPNCNECGMCCRRMIHENVAESDLPVYAEGNTLVEVQQSEVVPSAEFLWMDLFLNRAKHPEALKNGLIYVFRSLLPEQRIDVLIPKTCGNYAGNPDYCRVYPRIPQACANFQLNGEHCQALYRRAIMDVL